MSLLVWEVEVQEALVDLPLAFVVDELEVGCLSLGVFGGLGPVSPLVLR